MDVNHPAVRLVRERIADAIAAEHLRRAKARIEASPEDHALGFADAVLAVGEIAFTADAVVVGSVTDQAGTEWALHEGRNRRVTFTITVPLPEASI